MSNTNKCLISEHHKFLWWEWATSYYDHQWQYTDKWHRMCKRCGVKEIFFGKYQDSHISEIILEDWREQK